jgi:predicted anti-sigma-YlaC factor YlaD
MKCKQIQSELIFYLEGDLNIEKRKEIKSHLSECETCKNLAGNLNSSLRIIDKEKELKVNPYIYTRIQERINNYERRPSAFITSATRILRPVFVSAIIILGIFAGIKLGNYLNDRLINDVTEIQIESYYLNDLQHEPVEASLLYEELEKENIN